MTKRFVLSDTLPHPYFTVDAGADAVLTIKLAPNGEGRMAVEVWRDGTILCLVAPSVQIDNS